MGNAVAAAHFVIDTSRNGDGPNNMQRYASAPYDQPANVIGTLASGNWCDPPDSGLGPRPTVNTGARLLYAYLWVKTPGLVRPAGPPAGSAGRPGPVPGGVIKG